ncbi:inositol monophosphatase family protein [Marinoscillum furvescens]|uniref:Inositol-1-monophosphatase n=1 Tax=Marinoscillum furvescens DSM 4134 TaxID=1122208 RepID=A0A3D9L389_MARFU|nr:inositol monophosphatase family protein [Marinoscillum furvescens]RED98852.1 myo-inositol-1(or 4)-monophosphatase [Marinoscillum furvescens DSM 4134]
MIDLKNTTLAVSKLARITGAFIREEARTFSSSDVELKGKSDLVSYVDKETEKKLVEGLQHILPEAGFITEENTIDQTEKELTWIIDPLDGTTNFVHGLPTYAISVGLMQNGEMVAGVIYEINHDECFYAWKGGGAYLNEQPIAVTKAAKIDDSLFATGFPIYNFEKLDQYLAILNELMKNAHGLRRVGSAATDMAYVACGRYEAFFEYNLNPWDVAAGIIIVQEAGGVVTDFSGGPDALFGREMVAAGPVHAELLSVIRKHWEA